ncbi:MAG: gliding motility protein GldL [Bacteroidales bacterium]|nr:gliding motility protein GldL [Bacteroidales bacterium]
MNITDIVQSSGWKNFMAKLYGIGASVVIIGALFKIQHWKGAGIALTLGLSTEAIIFFFSAFEPLHEELDWTLVYPELAGMSDPDDIEQFKESKLLENERPIERIEDILEQSGMDDENFRKLGEGLRKLSETTSNLSDISKATAATAGFLQSLEDATTSINTIKETYLKTTDSIKDSVGSLSSAYVNTADIISKSGSEVANTYKNVSTSILDDQQKISKGNKDYEDKLETLNQSLAALNTVYELQIKDSNTQIKDSKELYSGLNNMITSLKESVEETNKYKEEVSRLKESLSSLNTIYGNMLSSMNMLTK